MKIVILSGGNGSKNIQKGIFDTLHKQTIDYTVITNLFDNGLSTGVCRKIYSNNILGPSDLRKNQLLRHKLIYGETILFKFLEHRVDFDSNEQAIEYILSLLNDLLNNNSLDKDIYNIFLNCIIDFKNTLIYNNVKENIFKDFSIANIIYSSLMFTYGITYTVRIMEKCLKIPKGSVVVSSYEPLFLKAITEKNNIINDEGDIVKWCNPDDKIIDCFFEKDNKTLFPKASPESLEVIRNADIIIFSTGTQWSSLIPTYKTLGIVDAINNSKAKKYLITNVTQDKDMYGVGLIDYLKTIFMFLKVDKLNVRLLISKSADSSMNITSNLLYDLSKNFKRVIFDYFGTNTSHDGFKVINSILRDYYNFSNDEIVFDFDDTLVSRDTRLKEISFENCYLINKLKNRNIYICTGNNIKKLIGFFDDIIVYSNRGLDVYKLNRFNYKLIKTLDNKKKLTDKDVENIVSKIKHYVTEDMIDVRDNSIIAIKPFIGKEREDLLNILKNVFLNFDVICAGKTTIEISKKDIQKDIIFSEFSHFNFIGDEFDGNDKSLYCNKNVNFLKVKDVKDTNIILRVLCNE